MSSEAEMLAFQKAALLDLIYIFESSEQDSFTTEEIKNIIRAYLTGKDPKQGAAR